MQSKRYTDNFNFGIEFELETSKRFKRVSYHGYSFRPDGTIRTTDSDPDECDCDYDEECTCGNMEPGEGIYGSFVASRDSSIETDCFPYAVELVSKVFKVRQYPEMLEEFKNLFTGKGIHRDKELNKLLAFNNSTGAHVNISLPKSVMNISDFMTFSFADIFRKKLFEGMEQLFVAHKNRGAYTTWQKRYYRHFSQKAQKWDREKYRDIRKRTRPQLIEFRGFHLYGITTWQMLNEAVKVFFDSLEFAVRKFVVKGHLQYRRPKSNTISFTRGRKEIVTSEEAIEVDRLDVLTERVKETIQNV